MKQSFFAVCPKGLEAALAEELAEIAEREEVRAKARFAVHAPGSAGVAFSGDLAAACAVNLHSRIASRVLWRVRHGRYRNENDLYMLARDFDWESHFTTQHTMRIDVSAHRSPLQSLQFATLRIKDAVCDRFLELHDERPSISTTWPDVRVFAHLTDNDCTLYLDTSGEPLFKRGWRLQKGEAPLKENLAAGVLRLAGWRAGQPLYDPMCGSGTFLIEAAQIALGIPPGVRREFAYERLQSFTPVLWQPLREAAQAAADAAKDAELPQIAGSDISTEMLAMAAANWERAGLPGEAPLKQVDVRHTRPPFDVPGMMIMNPPYGERIAVRGERAAAARAGVRDASRATDAPRGARHGADEAGTRAPHPARMPIERQEDPQADAFAAAFSALLKQQFAGWVVQVLTGDLSLPKRMRLKESRRTPLFNGPIECRLFRFEIVAGSMRDGGSRVTPTVRAPGD